MLHYSKILLSEQFVSLLIQVSVILLYSLNYKQLKFVTNEMRVYLYYILFHSILVNSINYYLLYYYKFILIFITTFQRYRKNIT